MAEPGTVPAVNSRPSVGVAWRAPMLVLGMLSLLGGVVAGLLRLGWNVPLPPLLLDAHLPLLHGPLMVSAFFGTVISLERAVALGRRWAFGAPLAAGLGGVSLLAGAPQPVAFALLASAAALLSLATLVIHRGQRQPHTLVLLIAALCWLAAGAGLVAGVALPSLVSAWMGFLVLTIAGERLELSRFLPPSPRARQVFALIVGLMLLAMPLFPAYPQPFGAVSLALALWLLRQDVARRTVRQQGLTRFIAVCLLTGYFWLAIGGGAMLAGFSGGWPVFAYDAALHAIFVGFVLSMVFGHAPVIFPAVLRVKLPYHPVFYLPLLLLHASLLLRVLADIAGDAGLRALGGAGNALSLVAFVLTMASAAIRGRR